MNTPSSLLPESSDISGPRTPRSYRALTSELLLLGSTYIVTFVIGSMFIAACGPGCCYVFYSIIAGVSGLLMLRQHFISRCVCLAVLLLSLFGMWHEKVARDTWGQRALRLEMEHLQKELQQAQLK